MGRPELLGTSLFDLTDKIAIVTGAGRGVGRMVALALAAAGTDIVASARTAPELEALCSEVRALGRRAEAVVTGVTVEASGEHLISTTVDRLGGLHILVNNAGINIRKPALALSLAEFQLVLDTNLTGSFLCAWAAGRHMVAQRRGKVIDISSILGRVALASQTAYASSKGALQQLTKVLALEWAQANVQVNAIGPAYLETELTRPLFEDPERNRFITERTPMGR